MANKQKTDVRKINVPKEKNQIVALEYFIFTSDINRLKESREFFKQIKFYAASCYLEGVCFFNNQTVAELEEKFRASFFAIKADEELKMEISLDYKLPEKRFINYGDDRGLNGDIADLLEREFYKCDIPHEYFPIILELGNLSFKFGWNYARENTTLCLSSEKDPDSNCEEKTSIVSKPVSDFVYKVSLKKNYNLAKLNELLLDYAFERGNI